MEKDEQVVFDQDDASVACEELWRCREVLLIGLASFGEIERLSNVQSNHFSGLHVTDDDGESWRPINPDLMVQYEDRGLGTVSDFAEALKYLDELMRKMLKAGEAPEPHTMLTRRPGRARVEQDNQTPNVKAVQS